MTNDESAHGLAHDDDPTPGGAALRLVPATPPPTLTGVRRHRAYLPRVRAGWHERGRHLRGELADAGMATAEYAIATLAAVGFAGVLVVILKGNEVKGLLLGIVRQALTL